MKIIKFLLGIILLPLYVVYQMLRFPAAFWYENNKKNHHIATEVWNDYRRIFFGINRYGTNRRQVDRYRKLIGKYLVINNKWYKVLSSGENKEGQFLGLLNLSIEIHQNDNGDYLKIYDISGYEFYEKPNK